MTATRRRFLCLPAALLLVGAGWSSQAQSPEETAAARLMDDLMWNRGPIGGPFALIDHTGKLRTDEDFRGKLLLIYFGYTYCPDVCPTDLQQIGLAVDGLGAEAEAVQPLFITLDPERDTAGHLADYVPLFHPQLIGLTGSAEQIRRVALAYKVYYAKYPPDSPDYVIDHSAFIYLVDEAGKYIGFFPPGTTADRMIEIITPHLSDRKKG
ncbi:MAG TPA: SCO family protein [Xanthobacteraceae bacterium]|jgi:protein SCO1/2